MSQNIDKLAAALKEALASEKKEEGLSHAEKVQLLKSIASDETGVSRKDYIQSRAAVLLPLIGTQPTVRKIFKPEVLTGDAQAKYLVSFDYTELATYLPKVGSAVVRHLESDELYIPTFGIEAGAAFPMDIAEQGRIDVAAEATRLLGDRVIAKEEAAGWATIKQTFLLLNTGVQRVYCSGSSEAFHSFSKKAVNKMAIQMDLQRRQLTDIFISPQSMGDVREWSTSSIDYLTQREIFVNGGLPGESIWNIRLNKVYDSNLVANTEAWGFDVRTFGKMPIRKELVTYEDPTAILRWEIGMIGRELVGFGVTDSYAVVKAELDSTHATTACSVI